MTTHLEHAQHVDAVSGPDMPMLHPRSVAAPAIIVRLPVLILVIKRVVVVLVRAIVAVPTVLPAPSRRDPAAFAAF
jgi:hypothetical protein